MKQQINTLSHYSASGGWYIVLVTVNPAGPENRVVCFPPAGQSPQARLRVYGSICVRRSPFPHPPETIFLFPHP